MLWPHLTNPSFAPSSCLESYDRSYAVANSGCCSSAQSTNYSAIQTTHCNKNMANKSAAPKKFRSSQTGAKIEPSWSLQIRSMEIRLLSLSSDLRIALDIFSAVNLLSSLPLAPLFSARIVQSLLHPNWGIVRLDNITFLFSVPYPCDGSPISHVLLPKFSSCPSISSRNRSSVGCLPVISIAFVVRSVPPPFPRGTGCWSL